MTPMKIALRLVLGIAAMAAGQRAAHANSPASPPIDWAPYELALRSGEVVAGEIGSIEVPQVRAKPASGTMEIAFVRLPGYPGASGPPIIYLAGGPGSSGIEAATGARYRLFERLRTLGDVILLDQRGVGLSSPPPKCSKPWRFPPEKASTEAAVAGSIAAALADCAAEWRAAGVNLEAYNTADNAADVADLIRALGVPKARLVGISYGTFLGFAVLRDHGSLIDRAVFAGTEGPDHTVKLPMQADRALAALSAEIASTAEGRRAAENLEQMVRNVFARLAKAPVVAGEGEDRLTISLYDAQVATFFLMGTSENAVRLPELYRAMERGDFEGMARMVRFVRGFFGSLPAMPFATDAVSPTSAERLREVRRQAESSLFGNAANFPAADAAHALGLTPLPERYRRPLRTAAPALFISGTLDARTPPGNAEEVRQGFATSAHLVIDGAGHDNDLFLSTPVILDRIESFFRGDAISDETVAVDILHFD